MLEEPYLNNREAIDDDMRMTRKEEIRRAKKLNFSKLTKWKGGRNNDERKNKKTKNKKTSLASLFGSCAGRLLFTSLYITHCLFFRLELVDIFKNYLIDEYINHIVRSLLFI